MAEEVENVKESKIIETEQKNESAEKSKEEKPISGEVKKIVDTALKLNSADRSRLGLEIIKHLTAVELSAWVKSLEKEFGVSATPVVTAGGAVGPAGAAPAAEEKTDFQVVLVSVGDKKIQVIKEVRAITNLGLKESKALVDGAPKVVKENLPKKEAEEVKAKLEAQGAKVELK